MNPSNTEILQQRAVAAALALLARRDHTSRELKQKLGAKGFDPDTCQAALARCRELGYLDDGRTAQAMVMALRRKGLGVHRIRAQLRDKGIDDQTIAALTDPDGDPQQALAAARAAYDRNRTRFERESDPLQRRAKIYRFLCARGFAADVIHRLLMDA